MVSYNLNASYNGSYVETAVKSQPACCWCWYWCWWCCWCRWRTDTVDVSHSHSISDIQSLNLDSESSSSTPTTGRVSWFFATDAVESSISELHSCEVCFCVFVSVISFWYMVNWWLWCSFKFELYFHHKCSSHTNVAELFNHSASFSTFTIGRIAYRWEGVFFAIDNAYVSGITRAQSLPNLLCMLLLLTSVARSSSNMFTIGCITYCWEGVFFPIENALLAGKGGWECTARVKYAIYNCLVVCEIRPIQ